MTNIADRLPLPTDSAADRDLRHGRGRAGVDASHLGGDRQHAQRPGLPPRLPPDRQPARRRGPHPGGLRPGLPLAVDLHARHLRGLAAPHHHQPLPGHGPPQAADPLRRARRRRGRAAAQPRAARPSRSSTTPTSTRTSSRRWTPSRPEFRAAVVLCDIEGLSYEEIAATLGVKLGTVRSRIHRGRSHLRKALAHRSPEAAAEQRALVPRVAAWPGRAERREWHRLRPPPSSTWGTGSPRWWTGSWAMTRASGCWPIWRPAASARRRPTRSAG